MRTFPEQSESPHTTVDDSYTKRIQPPEPEGAAYNQDSTAHRHAETWPQRRAKRTTTTKLSLPQWQQHQRQPYHEYVHRLIGAGWADLLELDQYMNSGITSHDLIISVLDIGEDFRLKRWPDIRNEAALGKFLADAPNKIGTKVRMFVIEDEGIVAPGVIEVLGSALALDPRFFLWTVEIHEDKQVFTPSQRHRANFIRIGNAVLNLKTALRIDVEKFNTMVYIQPDEHGDGFTGVIFINSPVKIPMSSRLLNKPPVFGSTILAERSPEPRSFRELYIESFDSLNLEQATRSPFAIVHYLLQLNYCCWSQIIAAISTEDRRINGISETSVGHAEEIKKSLTIVQRGGSLGWRGAGEVSTQECKISLEEDFKHLISQTNLLWENRDKLRAIKAQDSEQRWSSLTNAFTYLFAPLSIITGIYGMNVSQLSGDNANPNIWQPFVAVAILNSLFVLALAASKWISTMRKHGRKAGWKEVLGFVVGK